MNLLYIISIIIGFSVLIPSVYAETITQNLEGSMNIAITYPDELIAGREGIISILLTNNGWEEKQDISFSFSLSNEEALIINPSDTIMIEKLTEGGTYGENINVHISNDVKSGIHFLNLKYSQVLVTNNQIPQDPFFHNIAIPIAIKENPNIIIYTKMPEAIFANAEFPINIEIVSEDINITDIKIKIIPPKDIEFRGETLHTFSEIKKNTPIGITSQIITPNHEINTEYKLPFEIIVEYTDDMGAEKSDSQTVSVVLRPRTFMELTTDGGIWIGNFFIAPYISLGTIIGIPAGALISLLIRRNHNSDRKTKRRN